jgi:hypothetical protein
MDHSHWTRTRILTKYLVMRLISSQRGHVEKMVRLMIMPCLYMLTADCGKCNRT